MSERGVSHKADPEQARDKLREAVITLLNEHVSSSCAATQIIGSSDSYLRQSGMLDFSRALYERGYDEAIKKPCRNIGVPVGIIVPEVRTDVISIDRRREEMAGRIIGIYGTGSLRVDYRNIPVVRAIAFIEGRNKKLVQRLIAVNLLRDGRVLLDPGHIDFIPRSRTTKEIVERYSGTSCVVIPDNFN